jgi:hypothetical protein
MGNLGRRGRVRGGDGVSDGDLVVVAADQDFADDEPQDALLVVEGELVEAVAEPGEEALQGVGELEVGLGVVQLGVERVELGSRVVWRLRRVGIRARSSSSEISCSWYASISRSIALVARVRSRSSASRRRVAGCSVRTAWSRRSISARTSAGSSSSRRTSSHTSPSSSSARIGRLWQTRPPTWR